MAERWVVSLFNHILPRKARFRLLEEHGVDLTGSCGYPYKFDPRVSNKKEWLDFYSYRYYEDLELAKKIGFHEKPYYVWDCFPKVEILEAEKAKKKTRLICGAPAELVFLQDSACGDLNELIGKFPLKSKTAIGHNYFLSGWDELGKMFDSSVDCSDAKQWDSSMSPAWLHRVYRIRERLTILDRRQRNVLWFCYSELVNSILNLSSGQQFFVQGGNKSGSGSTCHDNSIGHIYLIAYCFVVLGFDYSVFRDFKFVVMGDDLVSDAFPPGFWPIYRSFGVNVVENFANDIYHAEFLSHRFSKTPWGIMPYHKNNKMLFSSFSHDNKKWKEYRYQKLFILYVLNFWHPSSYIFKHILDRYSIEFCDLEILYFWTGLLVEKEVLK